LWQGNGLPQTLTVDMGHALEIDGLTYLPRSDGKSEGIVDTFRFETSTDGQHWSVGIEHGRFGNIENNPMAQEARFVPVMARFFRFTALTAIKGSAGASAAEIGVMPADTKNRR
jgi:alpha-L-fucosidase